MIRIEDESIFAGHPERLAFHRKLRSLQLTEGYSYDDDGNMRPRPYWPTQPKNDTLPFHWPWATLKDTIREAGTLVGLGHGKKTYDRRVIALTNPGLGGEYAVTRSFFADFQLIRPGESTPSHRHTPCATRFIFEGEGWTTVGDERNDFSAGDIVFTGQFPWHDHGNRGSENLLFLDVLDIPLLQFLGASKWEFDYWSVTGDKAQHSSPFKVHNPSDAHLRQGDMRLCGAEEFRRQHDDFNIFRLRDIKAHFARLSHLKGSAYDGLFIEHTRPDTGGPAGATMSLFSQLLRPGEATLSHRHTSQTIYVAVEGEGELTVGAQVFRWKPNDVLVVPSWEWHAHRNLSSSAPAILHSISDASVLAKLNLFREERRRPDGSTADSGWQSHYF